MKAPICHGKALIISIYNDIQRCTAPASGKRTVYTVQPLATLDITEAADNHLLAIADVTCLELDAPDHSAG